ncbi:MAG: glycine--tRNA ligase subunit beta [bacterium]|nr:glycine--tRNA ligase subunit beta [bacterium]
MAKNNLLFELGFEELPVESNRLLREKVLESFASFPSRFKDSEFTLKVYSTPRRIAVFMEDIKLTSEVFEEEVKGPAENVIFAGDSLTKAGEGFLKSKQLEKDLLIRRDGSVFYKKQSGGEAVEKIFEDVFKKCISSISFDKTMKWDKTGFLFPRPIRWAMGFVNNNPMNFEIAGIKTDIYTFANRCISSSRMTIFNAYDYFEKMNENYVEIDFEKRKKMVKEEIYKAVEKLSLSLVEDEDLLDEVTDLVEFPVIFCGQFEEKFLSLPSEIIVAALKQHQRYFSLKKTDSSLSVYFVFVSNSPYAETNDIVKNNQRIIASRLEDAEFYYNNDLSHDLKYYEEALKKTVFHEQLGTFYDKVQRNKKLAEHILSKTKDDIGDLELLSVISKFDAATEMIKDGKEFTKLQGVIGAHYAEKMGYDREKASVSKEHYLPLTNEGVLPESAAGITFSVADKVDNICGAFVSGNKPTGSKDAMSVRRDSLSLIYLMIQKNLKLDVFELVSFSLGEYGKMELKDEIIDYLKKRMEVLFLSYGISYDITRCVLNKEILCPSDALKKANLIKDIKNNEDFKDIAGGLKRVSNILKNESERELPLNFKTEYEKNLYQSGIKVGEKNKALLTANEYENTLKNLLSLRKPIDDFFDNVMVMDEDLKLRETRIQLLIFIRKIFSEFGDFSQIVFESDQELKR